jgi:hypothetical protein
MDECPAGAPDIVSHFIKRFTPLLRLYPEEVRWVGTRIPIPAFDGSQISQLLDAARPVLAANCISVLDLPFPAWIVGDIHGNFHDILRILATMGGLPNIPIVFLGDYVDRGSYSIEVITLLFALKCAHPDIFYFIRGNHEFAKVNALYGFKEECDVRYPGTSIWKQVNALFAYLPLAIVLGGTAICLHGGIGPETPSLDDIRRIQLPFTAPEPDPVVSAVVWSDPSSDVGKFIASARGCGYLFGVMALKEFLRASDCTMLIRAHECVLHGIATFFHGQGLTVFSTSNYNGRSNQAGVIQLFDTHKMEPHQLHPIDSVTERNEAEFEAVTEVEESKKLNRLAPHASFSSLPQIRLASYPTSKLTKAVTANRTSGVVLNSGDSPASRRSAVKRLALGLASTSSLPNFSWMGVEDPQ